MFMRLLSLSYDIVLASGVIASKSAVSTMFVLRWLADDDDATYKMWSSAPLSTLREKHETSE